MSDDSTATVEATKDSKLSTGASIQEIRRAMVARLTEVRLHSQDFYMMGETEAKLILGELYPNSSLIVELIEAYSDSSSSNLPEMLDAGAGSLQKPAEVIEALELLRSRWDFRLNYGKLLKLFAGEEKRMNGNSELRLDLESRFLDKLLWAIEVLCERISGLDENSVSSIFDHLTMGDELHY